MKIDIIVSKEDEMVAVDSAKKRAARTKILTTLKTQNLEL
jgi:plasmid replication initiation protein